MSEKNCARKEGTNEELGEHTIRDSNRVPLDELLVNSTVPSTTVPVKVCDDSADEGGRDNNDKQKRGILTNFQRRTFSRISFKGESGPLLSRWIFLFFFVFFFFYRGMKSHEFSMISMIRRQRSFLYNNNNDDVNDNFSVEINLQSANIHNWCKISISEIFLILVLNGRNVWISITIFKIDCTTYKK